MPRPCAVVLHDCRYKEAAKVSRCHGLAPWSLMLLLGGQEIRAKLQQQT